VNAACICNTVIADHEVSVLCSLFCSVCLTIGYPLLSVTTFLNLVKEVVPQILQQLLFMYIMSFSTGIFSDGLEIAKVVGLPLCMHSSHLPYIIIVQYRC